jgi:hypothetical protein
MENFNQLLVQFVSRPGTAVLFLVWTLSWKGSALWKAAGKKQVTWFIVLLLVNTLGLLEIAYVFYLCRWDLGSGKLLAFWEKKTQKSKTPSSKRKR